MFGMLEDIFVEIFLPKTVLFLLAICVGEESSI